MRYYVLFLIAVLAAGCIQLQSCRNVTSVSEERFPYIAAESYETKEPYIIYLRHEIAYNITKEGSASRAFVELRNTDAEEGWFTVIFEFANAVKNGRKLVRPQEVATFTFLDEGGGNGTVAFSQSDPVTKYNVTVNQRNVTRYLVENVTKTAEVCG